MNPEGESMGDLEKDMYGIMPSELIVFLKDFPTVKRQIEEYIKELLCSADTVQKIHERCTFTCKAASSAGVVAGILTVVGLGLTPFTAGASLTLTACGAGLGAAAAATGASAKVIDKASDSRGRTQLKAVEEKTEGIKEPLDTSLNKLVNEILPELERLNEGFKNISPIDPKFKLLPDDPDVISMTKKMENLGRVINTTHSYIQGAIIQGIDALSNLLRSIKDSKDLSQKAETPTAEKLREKAEDLEKKLQDLSGIYEALLAHWTVKTVGQGSPWTMDEAES